MLFDTQIISNSYCSLTHELFQISNAV